MPVVLISRGTMSGGQSLGRCLSQRLSLRCVGREDLLSVVDLHGGHARKVVEIIERATRAYDQFSQHRRSFIILMRHALLGFIREDGIVYHGYAGHLLVPNAPCCMRVRISAPLPLRAKNAMQRLGLPEAQALEAVQREDDERVRWSRYLYGRDIRDPHLYDAWFSLERMSIDAVCATISAGLLEKEFQRTPEAQRLLDDLYLSTSVEAALVSDPRTLAWEIGARVRDGNVLLEGPFLEDQQMKDVLEVARAVEGAGALEYQPGCAAALVG
jgi:Cytidylate kinase-like family